MCWLVLIYITALTNRKCLYPNHCCQYHCRNRGVDMALCWSGSLQVAVDTAALDWRLFYWSGHWNQSGYQDGPWVRMWRCDGVKKMWQLRKNRSQCGVSKHTSDPLQPNCYYPCCQTYVNAPSLGENTESPSNTCRKSQSHSISTEFKDIVTELSWFRCDDCMVKENVDSDNTRKR